MVVPSTHQQNYVAPEVIKGRYRPAPADMWSLGVVAYVLISGVLPFNADTLDLIKHRISGELCTCWNSYGCADQADRYLLIDLF